MYVSEKERLGGSRRLGFIMHNCSLIVCLGACLRDSLYRQIESTYLRVFLTEYVGDGKTLIRLGTQYPVIRLVIGQQISANQTCCYVP